MFKVFLFIVCIVMLSSLSAQEKSRILQPDSNNKTIYTVKGIVRDGSTNEALAYANVIISEARQAGAIADAQGRFSFELSAGNYHLQCSYVGYKTASIPISADRDIQVSVTMNSIDVLLQNVTIYANQEGNQSDQKEVSALSLQSEKIRQSSSLMPDVLRTVQMLPGVSSNNEFSAKFNVRGGNQDENLVLINGSQVYEPYHVKWAPNASIGIFNVDMIKKMDLMSGGFSARYGDRMSSVVTIEYREGSRDQFKGQASFGFTDFDALAEGPIGGNGSFIIGARKSYLQYVIGMLDVESSIHPDFYDVQGVLAFSVAPQHKLSLKFIHAGDSFQEDPNQNFHGPYKWNYTPPNGKPGTLSENWYDSSASHAHYYSSMIALQSLDIISARAVLKTEFSYYDQREQESSERINRYWNLFTAGSINAFYRNDNRGIYNNDLHIRTLELNSTYDLQAADFYGIKGGAGFQSISYEREYINRRIITEMTNQLNYPDTAFNQRDENRLDTAWDSTSTNSFKIAGFIENTFQLTGQFFINIGGRVDYFDINKNLTFSPRVNLAYSISPELTLRGAWGHFYQSPGYQQIAYTAASDTNTRSQKAIHYIIGAEYDLLSDAAANNFLKFKVEGYYKTYDNLISSTVSSDGSVHYSKKNDAAGKTRGVDFYMMYSTPGFSGWICYSILKAEQQMINSSSDYFPRNTDQRHTFSALAGCELGKSWSIGTRLAYGSGYAYTPSVAVYNQPKKIWEWKSGSTNSAYLPVYQRIDLRISKSFSLFGLSASSYLDVSNIFNRTNVQAFRYHFDNQGRPLIDEVKLWPVIPTAGLSVKF